MSGCSDSKIRASSRLSFRSQKVIYIFNNVYFGPGDWILVELLPNRLDEGVKATVVSDRKSTSTTRQGLLNLQNVIRIEREWLFNKHRSALGYEVIHDSVTNLRRECKYDEICCFAKHIGI